MTPQLFANCRDVSAGSSVGSANGTSVIPKGLAHSCAISSARELSQFIFQLLDKNGPEISDYANLEAWFNTVAQFKALGVLTSSDQQRLLEAFGITMRECTLQGFVTVKPHGYAGDFEIIDKIYQNYLSPDERLVRWDKFFQAQAAVKAVRNRKALFHDTLDRICRAVRSSPRVLIIGSGPGRDILEHFTNNPASRASFDCVEQDPKAIAYASNLTRAFSHQVDFLQRNALKFHTSERYDLIWAGGIFDYFSDRVFIALLRRLTIFLANRGELIVGNFSEKNPTRACMEFGGWVLHHRTPEQLRNLAFSAGLQGEALGVGLEQEGVNLFLNIRGS